MLVEAQVSSMKISRSGSRSSWPSNQASRRLRMSGRSCSAACAVFFLRVIWWRRQKRQSALTLTKAPCSAKHAFNSGRVMSGTSARAAWISSAPRFDARAGRRPAAWAGHPRRLGASPANGSRWRRSRRTGPPPGGMIGPRRWRPEHESEGRRTALGAYRPVSLASRCPESDRPRFAYPGRLYQREHRSRPEVVEYEGQSNYRNSPSKPHMRAVEQYLERFSKAEERQRATTSLLIPFALLDTGFRLEGHLSAQRRYLRDKYDSLGDDPSRRRAFTEALGTTANF